MTHEKQKMPNRPDDAKKQKLDPGNRDAQRAAQHSEASGKAPSAEQQRETARENQPERGTGEGMTGMQRGAGHPTGR